MADEQIETGEQPPVEDPPADWGEDISPENDGGVYKKVLSPGVGAHKPLDGDEVFVHYTGRLLTGEVFDSSLDRNELFKFVLGEGKVIKGWDVGVATMTKNEKCLLTCKPEYAYGKEGSPPKIPPDSTLQFEVELFRWQGEDVTKDGGVLKSVMIKGEGFSKPTDGASCKVHICGITEERRVFEEKDVTFDFGEGSESGVISGVEKAIGQMKSQEKARVIVKPQYGYGDEGNPELGIPPNAELTYEIRLNSFEKAKQSWEYDTVEERRTSAEALKDRASNYFKHQKFSLADRLYERGAEIVAKNSVSKDEEKEALKDLRVVFHLNRAACHLKLKEPNLAITECEEALEEDKKSVKAFFRRGQAHQLLQDHEEAIADFKEVLKLEPGNKAAAKQIAQSKHELKAFKDREKKRYANLLKYIADDEDKDKVPEVMSPEKQAEGPGEEGKPAEEKEEPGEEGKPAEEKEEPGEGKPAEEPGDEGKPAEEKEEPGEERKPAEEKEEPGEEGKPTEEKEEPGEEGKPEEQGKSGGEPLEDMDEPPGLVPGEEVEVDGQ